MPILQTAKGVPMIHAREPRGATSVPTRLAALVSGLSLLVVLAALVQGCGTSSGPAKEAPQGGGETQNGAARAGAAETAGTKGTSGAFIPVGEYGSMTGTEAAFGTSTHNGIILAVDEIN